MGLWIDAQYRLLRKLYPHSPNLLAQQIETGQGKLALLGERFVERLRGKRVIDFGCGEGTEAVTIARGGAAHVHGIDIQESHLEVARRRAEMAGVADRCTFGRSADEPADFVISIDAFEHFDHPEEILGIMLSLLKPGGEVLFSFGPTWFHPLGGHFFSVFPWAHLVFAEEALIRWRGDYKSDGAMRFEQVAGGLNQMTIARFERIVRSGGFEMLELECVPIRKLKPLHGRTTREFTTALCRGRLKKPV